MKVMIWSSLATPASTWARISLRSDSEALLRDSNTLSPSQIGHANRLLIASMRSSGLSSSLR